MLGLQLEALAELVDHRVELMAQRELADRVLLVEMALLALDMAVAVAVLEPQELLEQVQQIPLVRAVLVLT